MKGSPPSRLLKLNKKSPVTVETGKLLMKGDGEGDSGTGEKTALLEFVCVCVSV